VEPMQTLEPVPVPDGYTRLRPGGYGSRVSFFGYPRVSGTPGTAEYVREPGQAGGTRGYPSCLVGGIIFFFSMKGED
jgi:hypothetical protein